MAPCFAMFGLGTTELLILVRNRAAAVRLPAAEGDAVARRRHRGVQAGRAGDRGRRGHRALASPAIPTPAEHRCRRSPEAASAAMPCSDSGPSRSRHRGDRGDDLRQAAAGGGPDLRQDGGPSCAGSGRRCPESSRWRPTSTAEPAPRRRVVAGRPSLRRCGRPDRRRAQVRAAPAATTADATRQERLSRG